MAPLIEKQFCCGGALVLDVAEIESRRMWPRRARRRQISTTENSCGNRQEEYRRLKLAFQQLPAIFLAVIRANAAWVASFGPDCDGHVDIVADTAVDVLL